MIAKPQPTAWTGPALALASAALFGASTPVAKLLLGEGFDPWLLAGLLYLGSGIGLATFRLATRLLGHTAAEAPLRRRDLPWLALVVLTGGAAGPVLLMLGLQRIAGSEAALLLNMEGLATMAIAWLCFREQVDRRLLVGAGCILAGAVLLSWPAGGAGALEVGALFIAGACLAWGIDNNLTRRLSSADPVQIAMTKGLAAGPVNLLLAAQMGADFPPPERWLLAGTLGLVGYGISLTLFVLALRRLGTARTGAYFSTGPFIGAALAVPLLGESFSRQVIGAGLLMAVGVYLHLTERHAHLHEHEPLEHEHRHSHDAHHQHEHASNVPADELHSHWHRHAPLRHQHPHHPDLHHRHDHS